MTTSLYELDLIGPPVEDLETRRLRHEAGRALFHDDAPDLMRIGRFEIQDEIGAGGQGAVYLVRDPKLDRQVALKRLGGATPRQVERMRREALALAQVSHDNVVRIFEVGEDETGRPFLVMELVEGSTLGDWLAQQRRRWEDVIDAFIAIGTGLSAIHAAGLIHRDVKPRNIVITNDGRAKLIDLGIAAADDEDDLHTEPGNGPTPSPMGTRGYMSPEQLAGRASASSDQFAFCVTLYEALYGQRPPMSFDGRRSLRAPRALGRDDGSKRGSTTSESPPATDGPGLADGVHGAPKRLGRVLARGLSHDPKDRYPDMAALVGELRRIRQPRAPWTAIVGIVAGVAVASVVLLRREPEGLCAQPAPAAALWQGARRDAVQAAFESTGSPEAARAFATVDGMFEASTRALDERLAQVCESGDDPATRELGLARILEQHGLLRSIAESLTTVDANALAEAPSRLATSLGRLGGEQRDACDVGAPASEASPALVAAEDAIQRATAEAVAGRYDAALDLAADALTRADGTPLASYRARLHLVRGRLALDARRLELARDELEHARSLAETLDCDGLGAEALALWAKAQALDPQPDVAAADHATKQALEKLDSLGDHTGPRRGEALNSRGLVLQNQQRYDEAIASYEAAISIRSGLTPPATLDVSDTYLNMGATQAQRGQTDAAIATLKQALELRERALWPEHPSSYRHHASLSYRYLERGDLDASEQALTHALQLAAGLGADHPRLAQLHVAMAKLLDRRRQFERALQHAEQADAILTKAHGEDAPQRIPALEAIGVVCVDAVWPDRAIPALERALEIQAAAGNPAVDLAIGRGKLAHAHASAGRHETAMLLFEQAQRPFAADPSLRSNTFYPELQLRHGESLLALGREDEAVEALRSAEQWWEERSDNPERLAIARWSLAQALCPRGMGPELARQALAYFESAQADGASPMRSTISAWLERPCPRAEPPHAGGPSAREPGIGEAGSDDGRAVSEEKIEAP